MDQPTIHSYINYGRQSSDIKNRVNSLNALLEAGADVDEREVDKGRTPLQAACWEKDDGAIIRVLLKHGASVATVDNNGDTALHGAAFHSEGFRKWPLDQWWRSEGLPVPASAARELEEDEPWGALEAVKALVEAGADPNALNPRTGYTPLHWASINTDPPYLEALEILHELGGQVSWPCRAGWRPMDFLVARGDEKAADLKERFVRAALKESSEGFENLAAGRLKEFSFESPQIMMWDAVVYNDPILLETALSAGADPNLPMAAEEYEKWFYRAMVNGILLTDGPFYEYNFYVLFEALGKIEVLKVLLAHGTEIVTWSYYWERPLLRYVIEPLCGVDNQVETLVCLLEAGADVDMRFEGSFGRGRTALQYACWEKLDGAIIMTLLRYGASVTAVDDDGNTALHGAGYHDEGYKNWPLDYDNADFSPEYIEKYQPWGAREAVNALVDAGADPNAINPDNGYTPMHWAVVHSYAYLQFLEALFERGGRVDIPDKKGMRPVDFYYEGDYPEAEALRKKFKDSMGES